MHIHTYSNSIGRAQGRHVMNMNSISSYTNLNARTHPKSINMMQMNALLQGRAQRVHQQTQPRTNNTMVHTHIRIHSYSLILLPSTHILMYSNTHVLLYLLICSYTYIHILMLLIYSYVYILIYSIHLYTHILHTLILIYHTLIYSYTPFTHILVYS